MIPVHNLLLTLATFAPRDETELHISPPSSPAADPCTSRSYGSKLKTKSKLMYHRRKGKLSEPPNKIGALEGDMIASHHRISAASIDCEFYKIECGQFKDSPSLLIIVDMRLVYSPDDIIDGVKIEFEFAKDVAQTHWPADLDCAQMTKAPIYRVFAPECIEGMPSYSQRTTHHNIRQAKGRRSDLQVGL